MDAVTWVPRSCRTRSPAPAGRVCYCWLLPRAMEAVRFRASPRNGGDRVSRWRCDAERGRAEQNRAHEAISERWDAGRPPSPPGFAQQALYLPTAEQQQPCSRAGSAAPGPALSSRGSCRCSFTAIAPAWSSSGRPACAGLQAAQSLDDRLLIHNLHLWSPRAQMFRQHDPLPLAQCVFAAGNVVAPVAHFARAKILIR